MRQELYPTKAQRAQALVPYEAMAKGGIDAIMVSLAGFPTYDGSGRAAALSRPVITGLLRNRLRFGGVIITDCLRQLTGYPQLESGVLAAEAGADILMLCGGAPGELPALTAAIHTHQLSFAEAASSYRRIIALKAKLGLMTR